MKLNLRSTLPLLMGVAIFYSACKKADNKPASTGPSTDEVSAAIAKNLAESLSGAYGGASIKDGINKSANLSSASAKLKTQAEVQCGFFTDNGLDVTAKQGDTLTTHTTGSVNYFFVCNNSKIVGYDLIDSVLSKGKGPGYDFTFEVVQNYHARGVNTNNSNFTLNGTLKSFVDYDYKAKPKNSSSVHNTFTLSDLYVHADDNYDITSGTGVIESQGTTSTGAWDYSATVVFLGNHKAKLNFVNQLYLVDLLTGTVTRQ